MITQQGRWLLLESPLGKDALILTAFEGDEAVSRPYSIRLTVLSIRTDLQAKDVLGKAFTASIRRHDNKFRLFHGLARSLATSPVVIRGYREYTIELVPWLWFLTLRSDCRIFEHKTAINVIRSVFEAAGYGDFDDSGMHGKHPIREYCVQYRESDFDFVSRLMEEEGIFYFFRHEAGRHVMVMGDQISAYVTSDQKLVSFSDAPHNFDAITEWQPESRFFSGKAARRDYDFKSASVISSSTSTVIGVPDFHWFESYDYPGGSEIKANLEGLTLLRMEEEELQYQEVYGKSTCQSFTPGYTFIIEKHPSKEEVGKGYCLTAVRHWSVDETHIMDGSPPSYSNTFHCIPKQVIYRPPRITPKALVRGPQVALVVGPEGEEIHTDAHGRIRVRFFWDRKSGQSCWTRVAQAWAGKGWGTLFIPRVGMEVVVNFLEGDPDRPLVVGAVYNGKNPPPYTQPAKASRSGIKTRSTKGGGEANFNELSFDDTKGAEEVYLHGEKNFNRVVENNDSLHVGNDQTITIKKNRTEKVESGNESVTIASGNRAVVVAGNDSLTVSKGNKTTEVSSGKVSVKAMQAIELKVGSNSILIDQSGITLKGILIKVEGSAMVEVKGPMVKVSGDGMVTIKGGIVMVN
ncbi:MAG: type VI secretion system tip protein VgrG [Magnetococcus sp. DMHC-1]